jgi:hypothetical protein
MATPIVEQIATNILALIQSITTDNGYNYTLSAVRPTKAGQSIYHLSTVIEQADPEEMGDNEKPNFTLEWHLPFRVFVVVQPEESDTTPLDTYCNLIRSDIEKASQIDYTRGGLAIDTRIRSPRFYQHPNLAYWLCEVTLEVDYRTKLVDPYVIA